MKNLLWSLSAYLFLGMAFAAVPKSELSTTFLEVKNSYLSSDVMVVDKNKLPFEEVRVSGHERSLPWVKLTEVSHAFKTLLIKSEDRNFYEHSGVDWMALMKAGLQHFTDKTNRGASTISMQLVGLLDQSVARRRRTFKDKWNQIEKALYLEKHWKKEEIFEAYINMVAFRGELVGLNSASFGYFNKAPGALNNEESALLVALLRSPNAPAELVGKRACQLLDLKECDLIKTFSQMTFNESYEIKRPRKWLSVLDDSFIKETEKNTLVTTLDRRVQQKAVSILQEQIRLYKKQNLNDGAILVLNNNTGEVMAYVANAGEDYSIGPHVDGIRAKRQAGSTLKPFVYATAIDLNLIDKNSLIDDSPLDIPIGSSIYYPRNYDNTFKGLVSAGEALGSSLNVPAVKTLQLVGGERVIKKMEKLGFSSLKDAGFYGPSLALGSVDVSLWDLTHAYQKLLRSKIFSKKSREEIFQMLASDENRRYTFGIGSVLQLPFHAAVKTGTSKDMRDNWCVGFSKDYTVGVWAGNFNGKAMWNVSGVTGAAPMWRAVMMELHKNNKDGIIFYPSEKSVADLPVPLAITHHTLTSIRYPIDREIVGLDPEIPERLQKILFEITTPQSGHKLFLDDEYFSDADKVSFWGVKQGKHKLALMSAENTLIDQVQFEVR
jgi:penicillin-binding protein 1C